MCAVLRSTPQCKQLAYIAPVHAEPHTTLLLASAMCISDADALYIAAPGRHRLWRSQGKLRGKLRCYPAGRALIGKDYTSDHMVRGRLRCLRLRASCGGARHGAASLLLPIPSLSSNQQATWTCKTCMRTPDVRAGVSCGVQGGARTRLGGPCLLLTCVLIGELPSPRTDTWRWY
jgi:hypothetical protein